MTLGNINDFLSKAEGRSLVPAELTKICRDLSSGLRYLQLNN